MQVAASPSPPEVKRAAQAVGHVLDRGAVNMLPRVGEIEVPTGPGMDWASFRCRELWCSVVAKALSDAKGRGFGRATDTDLTKRYARAWLRTPSADRDLVLAMAEIDAAAFVDFGLPHLELVWRQIDELKLHPRPEHTFRRKAA